MKTLVIMVAVVLIFTVTACHRRDQDIVVCESLSLSSNADRVHEYCPTHSRAERMTDSAEPAIIVRSRV